MGVFNFADTYIISGGILMLLYIVFNYLLSPSKEDKEEEIMQYELIVDDIVLNELKKKNK
ncbi:UNVERIFIED_CONTAM: hypothetical protein O8I53_11835 [Campylobacter lari]